MGDYSGENSRNMYEILGKNKEIREDFLAYAEKNSSPEEFQNTRIGVEILTALAEHFNPENNDETEQEG